MRNLLILCGFLASLAPAKGMAESKVGPFIGWFPSHTEWNMYKKYNPYLENGRHPHPEIWANDPWKPSDWIGQRKNGLTLVQGYYNADIIRAQDIEDNVAVVTVGPNFYRLGGQDKRRVVSSLDNIYGITAQSPNGTILLRDWHTRLQIGAYTKHGLMIQ